MRTDSVGPEGVSKFHDFGSRNFLCFGIGNGLRDDNATDVKLWSDYVQRSSREKAWDIKLENLTIGYPGLVGAPGS